MVPLPLMPDSLRDIAAALVSGVLMALAFPALGWGWLAWLALVPLLLVMRRRPFLSGFCAGTAFFALLLYWLNGVMTTYGHLPMALSVVLYLLLVAYLGCFWAATLWCACRVERRLEIPMSVALPVVWVVAEFVRGHLLTGFPWGALAYSQAAYPLLMQSADLGGIYPLIFLLVLSNVVIAAALAQWRRLRILPWRPLALLLALLLSNAAYGGWRLATTAAGGGDVLRLALVQGNIDQAVKWSPDQVDATLDKYCRLSRAGAAQSDLLIWPESATPFFFQDDSPRSRRVRRVSADTAVPLLFGSPAYMRTGAGYRYLNSVYLLDGHGDLRGRSDKVHLVPFGEYVPLAGLLSFVDKLVAGVGNFVPGRNHPLELDGHRLAVLVCYEAIFPAIARAQVAAGAQLLVNVTNDAWFGNTAAPWQHLDIARFRAVENRVWLARCANTGVSAIIDPAGRVVVHSSLFVDAVVRGCVYFCDGTSLYTRTGDTVPLLLCVVVALWLWCSRTRRLRAVPDKNR